MDNHAFVSRAGPARQCYERSFRQYFEGNVDCLTEERFWQLQPVLVADVWQFRFAYGRTNGVEHAAGEFFRKPRIEDFRGLDGEHVPAYSLEEATRFAKTWRELTRRLYQPLFDVVRGRSDDAYGDLLDSLPLAGREVVNAALTRQFTTNTHFEDSVRFACRRRKELGPFILQGENYVATALFDAAQESFSLAAAEQVTS